MADLIYTPSPASIPKFLRHVQSAGVPDKVTQRYLVGIGFKSTNDRPLIRVMKSLGFIDGTGAPRDLWTQYRDKSRSKVVLGAAIKSAYSELFATYPDADRKDTEALRNFFSAKTKVAETTLQMAVATFRTLVSEATFDTDDTQAAPPAPLPVSAVRPTQTHAPVAHAGDPSAVPSPSININIELHLPETGDADVYDKLFAAMRKHLFDRP